MPSGQNRQGKEIEFNAKHFDELSESACRFLIAHELGHCMQYAQGIKPCASRHDNLSDDKVSYCDSDGNFWGYKEDIENDANRWARVWGQSENDLKAWEQSKLESKLANGFVLPDQGNFDDLVDYDYTLELSCSGVIGLLEKQNIEDIKEGARILMLLQKADVKEVIKFTVKRECGSEERKEISLNNPIWNSV